MNIKYRYSSFPNDVDSKTIAFRVPGDYPISPADTKLIIDNLTKLTKQSFDRMNKVAREKMIILYDYLNSKKNIDL